MIFLSILLIIPLLWMAGFLWATDLSIPLWHMRSFRRVLVIFPHADDETITCGGFLHHLSQIGQVVTLIILTKGERGNHDAHLDVCLKEIRMREAQAAATILGISHCVQGDFADGSLGDSKREMAAFIASTIEHEQPELLITYDLAGYYGHADHIACSEVVTDLQRRRFPEISLWYATFPKRILAKARLPEHLASSLTAQGRQSLPTQRIFIGTSIFPKIRAWYTYKSQRASLTQGVRWLPFWFFLSITVFEYFAEVREINE